MQTRLFAHTFRNIEQEIVMRRMGKVAGMVKGGTGLLVNCAECGNKRAVLECKDCKDHFCQECSL